MYNKLENRSRETSLLYFLFVQWLNSQNRILKFNDHCSSKFLLQIQGERSEIFHNLIASRRVLYVVRSIITTVE